MVYCCTGSIHVCREVIPHHYSDFWELDAANDTSSETIVERTKKSQFARYSIPDKVITDNRPQFRAQLYEDFTKQWGFNHVTSSPYHSQSNGKAESAVKITKGMLKKDNKDINLAMLSWRNTPTAGGHHSPVQKFHSWRTRTQLPTSSKLLKPSVASRVVDAIQHQRQQAKIQYDRTAKELANLLAGQTVCMQPVKQRDQWKKATVIEKVSARSYIVFRGGFFGGGDYNHLDPNLNSTIILFDTHTTNL